MPPPIVPLDVWVERHRPNEVPCKQTTIPFDTHPHILDAILAYSPFSSLLVLRRTSRDIRDRVDQTFLGHIAVHPAVRSPAPTFFTYHHGGYRRLPRSDWLGHATLTDAVRIVDIVVKGKEDVRVDFYGESLGIRRRSDRGIYSPFCAICWCRKIDRDQPLLRTLGAKLKRVKLVRRWGGHICSNPIPTERTVDFYPPGDAEPFRPRKWKMKKTRVDVVHAAYPVEATIRSLPFASPTAQEAVVRITVLPPACLFPWEEQSRWQARHAWDILNMSGNVVDSLHAGTKCTLVGLDAWHWQLPKGHDDMDSLLRWDVRRRSTYGPYQTSPERAEDLLERLLLIKAADEYSEELDPEVETLEAYCSWPPASS